MSNVDRHNKINYNNEINVKYEIYQIFIQFCFKFNNVFIRFFFKMMNVDSNFSNSMTIMLSFLLKIITFINIIIYKFTPKIQQKLQKTTKTFSNI